MLLRLKGIALKLLIILTVFAICLIPFTGCSANPSHEQEMADIIEKEIADTADWVKGYYGLEAADSLNMLPPTVNSSYSASGKAIATNVLRFMTVYKNFGLLDDSDVFYNKLVEEFESIYGNGKDESIEALESIGNAYIPTINVLIRFLHTIDKSTTDFCGYNLEELHIYNNENLINYPDAYSLSYALTTYNLLYPNNTSPQNRIHSADDLLTLLINLQSDNGFWGYDDWYGGGFINDTDYTATAMLALGSYKDRINVNQALSKASSALLTFKNSDDTYDNAYNSASCSSTALALRVFSVLRENVFKTAIEEKTDPLKALWLFKNTDGGYSATTVSGEAMPDEYSTADAVETLSSVYSFYTA